MLGVWPRPSNRGSGRWLTALAALAAVGGACSEGGTGTPVADGGGFALPDAQSSPADAAAPRDVGPAVDAGPFVCEPACPAGQVCACPDTFPLRCGCVEPASLSRPCDPAAPESCQAGLVCVEALKYGRYEHVCSDGSEGTPCSRREPSCTTTNGCVCISGSPLGTSCACQGAPRAGGPCDPNAPMPCPTTMTCVPVSAGAQSTWYCSDGGDGSPCVPLEHEAHCETELGCTCPIYRGTPMCVCRNRGTNGQLCDPTIAGACLPGLECRLEPDGDTPDQRTSRCFGQPTEIPCDPLNPGSCPLGWSCTPGSGGQYSCKAPATDGGVDESCIPELDTCPRGYECREVSFMTYRCEPLLGDPDGGSSGARPCDPLAPNCPVGEFCTQVRPGEYECRPL